MLIEIIIFLVTVIVSYYLYIYKKIHHYFDKNDVKYLPGLPVVGNALQSLLLKRHIIDELQEIYQTFPDERYCGYIEGTTPIIMIRDPELVKAITVKDFDHFMNHKNFFAEDMEPLFDLSLFMMKNEKWRDMRTTLSPAFTGSKMKLMIPFMKEISQNIISYLKEHNSKEVDVDDIIRRYTNDVIASTAFGLQVNSLVDKENEFYKAGQKIFKFTLWQNLLIFFSLQFPKLAKKLDLAVISKKLTNFFRNVVSSTIDYRKKNNVERPDMIQLLMEATKGTLTVNNNTTAKDDVGFATTEEILKPQGKIREWTLDELTGQVFIFFIAGFETSASTLVLCLHELALNTDIQEKLYQEVRIFQESHGDFAYDNIAELKYLDCVLNETTRRWAAAIILDRVCTKAYELPPSKEGRKPCKLNPGDIVYNPVNAIHMDPKNYPNPEVFDPDRFSDENRKNIKPCTFIPFGSGPRNCIGSRFALLELKILLYYIILNFKVVKTAKTLNPIVLNPKEFNIKVKDGTYLKFELRA